MATTTTRKRGKAEGGRGKAEGARPRVETVEPADLDPKLIDPSPFQPRVGFPAEEISRLAFSIREVGLLQPVIVRMKDHRCGDCGTNAPCRRYELVDGERRLRAVKELKLPTIRAEIVEQTDAQARAIVLVSALQRADLNAIEEARAFRAAIDAGDAAGPTELAAQFGLSQGHVSHRLRLLRLPESIQKRIISREIPPTHARHLVPLKDHPKLLERIVKAVCGGNGQNGSVTDFADEVGWRVKDATEPIGGSTYSNELRRNCSRFKPTADQREQLGIIDLESIGGKLEEWATNTVLWKKLQGEHVARLIEKDAARQKKTGSSGKAAGKAKPLTPAQQKAAAEEERRKAKERAAQFRKRLYEWKIDWQRYLIGMTIRDDTIAVDSSAAARLLLYFAASNNTLGTSIAIEDRTSASAALLRKRGITVPTKNYNPDVWTGLAALENAEAVGTLADEFLAECFWTGMGKPPGEPNPCVPPADVEAIADFLCIDLARAWKTEQAGPLSGAYWNLHTKSQLADLIESLGGDLTAYFKPGRSKAGVAEALLASEKLPLPKEILKIKRPR